MFVLWIASVGFATAFEVHGNPRVRGARRQRRRRQQGGQGDPLRPGGVRAVRRLDDGDLDRRRDRGARQLHAARRSRPAGQHDARRGLPGRRRRRPLRDADLRPARRLHRRADGRTDARVPRQEDPGGRDEARRPLPPGRADADPRLRLGLRRARRPEVVDPESRRRTASPRSSTRSRRPANNNGSAFGGLTGNTDWYNTTLGPGDARRPLPARSSLVLAIAGSLARKQPVPATAGTFPTGTPLFAGLLVGVILIVVGAHVPPRPRARADPGAAEPVTLRNEPRSLFDRAILLRAARDSFVKLDPRRMARNPVMFVVEIGSVLVTVLAVVRPERVRLAGRGVALVHGAVRELRRGGRGRPGESPGGRAAEDACGHDRPSARQRRVARGRAELDVEGRRRGRRLGRRGDPRRRRRSSKESRASTSRRSPASPHPSSASRAATARRSPAAPACCPTGSSCR